MALFGLPLPKGLAEVNYLNNKIKIIIKNIKNYELYS